MLLVLVSSHDIDLEESHINVYRLCAERRDEHHLFPNYDEFGHWKAYVDCDFYIGLGLGDETFWGGGDQGQKQWVVCIGGIGGLGGGCLNACDSLLTAFALRGALYYALYLS